MAIIIGHRGASSLCPENSRSALLKALELGAGWLEIDLRLTRDGHWVVIHDKDLGRFCGDKRKIESLSLSELKAFDLGSWFHPAFQSERILTLGEACDLILPSASVILDIKTQGRPSELARHLLAAVSSRDLQKIVFSSFSLSVLKAFRAVSPSAQLGYLFDRYAGCKARIACREKFYSIHPYRTVVDADMIRKAHQNGIKVFVWTVNRPEEMRALFEAGADGVFTDFPQRARALCHTEPVIGEGVLCR